MSLGDLQILLEDAVRQEDYATAARLRDQLAYVHYTVQFAHSASDHSTQEC